MLNHVVYISPKCLNHSFLVIISGHWDMTCWSTIPVTLIHLFAVYFFRFHIFMFYSISTNTLNLRSATPIPIDNRRIRISGCLLGICDTLYIPELRYNGTIIDILGRFVIVLPDDYGTSIHRLPQKLETGNSIASHQSCWYDRISAPYHDNTLLLQGTFPARH